MPQSKSTVRPDQPYANGINPPIHYNASYFFRSEQEVKEGLQPGNTEFGRYGRYHNPTWSEVEARLADLCESEEALLFASGMASHFTTFISLFKRDSVVAYPEESYRHTRKVFQWILPEFGIKAKAISIRDPTRFVNKLAQLGPSHVHLEMPSSPHMYLIDVQKVREVVGTETIITMDGSFAPPPNFFPSRHGVDLAIYSATKYLGGHGDIVCGAVVGRRDLIEVIARYRDTTGAIASGNTAWLLGRSLRTLHLRMKDVNEKAHLVATHLDSHPQIKQVFYTGLEKHPHRELANRYLHGHGGVVTFEVEATKKDTARFVDALQSPYMASNFGAPQSLVEQSTVFTYYEYNEEQLRDIGVSDGTVRLSVGYEDDVGKLIEDIDQALHSIR